jgi:SSU ribosomal protein S1P
MAPNLSILSEVLEIGQEIDARVLKFDREKNRVSLGIKQLTEDPWKDIQRRYPEGARVFGKVTNITDYGSFVELEDGVEGLVHSSEMDWTNKNIHPSKITQVSDDVEVMILDIDEDRRRISLGMKQCQSNPWEDFAASHAKGEKVTGNIKSITDFGVFVGLDGGIDGLIHLSDLSWEDEGEDSVRNYKKGDEIVAVILAVDAERERISLGLKQASGDPFTQFLAANAKGSVVKAVVVSVDEAGVEAMIDDEVEAYMRAGEASLDGVADLAAAFEVGSSFDAKVTSIERKNRKLCYLLKV